MTWEKFDLEKKMGDFDWKIGKYYNLKLDHEKLEFQKNGNLKFEKFKIELDCVENFMT